MAWAAWLGFYNGVTKKLNISKEQLVQRSSEYASVLGLSGIPALPKKTIGKMGLQVSCNDDVMMIVMTMIMMMFMTVMMLMVTLWFCCYDGYTSIAKYALI